MNFNLVMPSTPLRLNITQILICAFLCFSVQSFAEPLPGLQQLNASDNPAVGSCEEFDDETTATALGLTQISLQTEADASLIYRPCRAKAMRPTADTATTTTAVTSGNPFDIGKSFAYQNSDQSKVVVAKAGSGSDKTSEQMLSDPNSVDAEDFRNALVGYLFKLQDEAIDAGNRSLATGIIDQILSLDREQMETWFSYVPDKKDHVALFQRLANKPAMKGPSVESRGPSVERSESMATPPTTVNSDGPMSDDYFWPDYPPNSGQYGDHLIHELQIKQLLPGDNPRHQRCEINEWADRFAAWDKALQVTFAVEAACLAGGCDPLGIGCAIVCIPAAVSLASTSFLEIPIRQCDAHIGNVDSAEIQAAYQNTRRVLTNLAHTHDDLEELDDDVATHVEVMRVRQIILLEKMAEIRADLATHDTNIDNDLAAHDANIDGDLAAHDANIDGDIAVHDTRLINHDINIDTDLIAHDENITARMETAQYSLDNKVGLRLVHLQVIEVENRKQYMVITTDAGAPADINFEAIEVFNTKTDAFITLGDVDVLSVATGVYLITLNLPPTGPDKIFRIQVKHDDTEDHFGQIVFHREKGST